MIGNAVAMPNRIGGYKISASFSTTWGYYEMASMRPGGSPGRAQPDVVVLSHRYSLKADVAGELNQEQGVARIVEERPFRAAFSCHPRSAFRPSGATGAKARLRLPRCAALKRRSSTSRLSGAIPKASIPYSSFSFSGSSLMPIFESR